MLRVLIADRDEELLEAYGRFLANGEVEALLVSRGVDCVARLRDSRPDVLVLETGLLWGRADDVLAWMHSRRHGPAVPVILLATENQPDQLCRALDFPIDEFLVKPVGPQELLKKIRLVLDGRSPSRC
jgi:DNA-binding response OmpR family regulator